MTAAPNFRATQAPWLVLAASLLFTAAATTFLTPTVRDRDQARFHNAVQGPEDRIRQILLNLLTNALKFTPGSGAITVGARREGSMVVIEVSDTGRGVPAHRLRAIFDPFVQVDRKGMTMSQLGVGLGLAISRELALAMDGTLHAESEPGVGSTFRLTLPAAA